MSELTNPQQLSFFSELSLKADIKSITNLSQFDNALNNLIKISEFGAFIQLKIQGLHTMYTLDLQELDVPENFLKSDHSPTSMNISLFSKEIRENLQRFSDEATSFFTDKNSFPTPSGFFLYRSHFTLWKHFAEKMKKSIDEYIYSALSHGSYTQHLIQSIIDGLDFIGSAASPNAPWEISKSIHLKDIETARNKQEGTYETLHNLKNTDPCFPLKFLVLKTQHFPLSLSHFISHVQVYSIFKSIHLEFLADSSIESISDIKELVQDI